MNTNQMLAELDQLLGHPRPQRPSRGQRLQAITFAIQQMVNQSNNTQVSRVTGSVVVNVPAGKGEIEIAAPDFGQALYIHTENPADPYFVEEPVDIVLPQNLHREYVGPRTAVSSVTHQAECFAIYQEGAAIKAMVRPVHTVSGRYRLWYKTGKYLPGLGTEMPLPQFHPLALYKAAFSLLSNTEWIGLSEQQRAQRVAEKRQEHGLNADSWERDFKSFITTNHQAKAVERVAYGDEDEDDDLIFF